MDENIRKLTLHKHTYSKYCAKCGYCIKAEWAKNKGVEWGQLVVYCCATGGERPKEKIPICPHGISYTTKLGQEEPEFNPEDWGPERFIKEDNELIDYEEEDDELMEKAIRRKKKGRRTDKGTFHGKSRGKYKQREF